MSKLEGTLRIIEFNQLVLNREIEVYKGDKACPRLQSDSGAKLDLEYDSFGDYCSVSVYYKAKLPNWPYPSLILYVKVCLKQA